MTEHHFPEGMPPFLQEARRSGRTTRMLLEVIELSAKGHAVYVLCAHKPALEITARLFTHLVWDLCRQKAPSSVKFETWESLGRSNVDLNNSRILGARSNCRLLIDPDFFEHHFSFALCGFHKYDKTNEPLSWDQMDWDLK